MKVLCLFHTTQHTYISSDSVGVPFIYYKENLFPYAFDVDRSWDKESRDGAAPTVVILRSTSWTFLYWIT